MKEYAVVINGIEHTLMLDASDAKRYDVEAKATAERAPESTDPEKKLGAAQNKARSASNK